MSPLRAAKSALAARIGYPLCLTPWCCRERLYRGYCWKHLRPPTVH